MFRAAGTKALPFPSEAIMNRTARIARSLGRRALCSASVAALSALTACGTTDYTLTGLMDVKNETCDGVVPPNLVMTVTLGNENAPPNSITLTKQVPAVGAYAITIPWDDNDPAPTKWRVDKVVLPNGNDICGSMNCAAPDECQDAATKARSAPVTNPVIDWPVRCRCQ
jgi:hypothetical protein